MSKGNRNRKRPDRKRTAMARAGKGWKDGLRAFNREKDQEWLAEQAEGDGERALADRVWDGFGYGSDD